MSQRYRNTGKYLLLVVTLSFGFTATASPKLVWEAGKRQPLLSTRLSVETLRHLENRVETFRESHPEILVFSLSIAAKNGNAADIKDTLQKLKKTPEPLTVAGLAARLQFYLMINEIKSRPRYSEAIKRYAQALEKMWNSYSYGQTVLAEDAATAARTLLRTGKITHSADILANGVAVLRFMETRLVGAQGAWHYFSSKTGRASLNGQLADNAALGLAFYEGYKVTGDVRWLDQARSLAAFILNRFYDRKLGGFFSRNSTSSRFYKPQELFVADKFLRSNGMAALLLYRVGGEVGNRGYMEAAARSVAALQDRALRAPPKDITALIYTYQALLKMNRNKPAISAGELQYANFGVIVSLSFIAGILGFLSPCTLPILPAYFAFASQSEGKNILLMTIAFFSGLAFIFSLMGATATLLGALVSQHHEFLLRTGGVLIILFGLASLLGKGFSGAGLRRRPTLSLAGTFFFGMTFSVGWTACIGPILGVMLIMAATTKTALSGAVSLFVFALGLSLPLMILSLYLGRLDRNGRFWRFLKGKGWEVRIAGHPLYLHTTGIISGLIFISLGVLMVTGYLTYLNRIFPVGIQAWFAGIEDSLVSRLGK
ncbi:MAG: cytochrome c biogenesis protein CcdA [Mariprofundaceae bacterium]|nr:cytochrome c biogenesis protein CcdA [Mariprofundaceae bacterium]